MRRRIRRLCGFITPNLILLSFMLSGCAPAPRDITMFAMAPVPPAQNIPISLLLAPVGAAPVYMSKDLLYRLSYAENQLYSYGNSKWSAPPAAMFASVLRQAAGSNLLVLDQSQQLARCTLRIELTSFEQVFTDAKNSHAELGLHFHLMRLRDRRELGSSKLRLEIPAQTADARGGAMALEKASHQAASQIIEWLNRSLVPTAPGTNPIRAACER